MSRPPHAARIAALPLLLTACSGAPEEELPIRHVLLISLDTTRASSLGCYGAPDARTEGFDRLAREGVLFEQCTSPAPTTLSSHTSMMTGTWPHTHGVVRNGFPVHPDNVMLAELLRAGDRRFHTAGFLGSFALESRFGFDQGFLHFDEAFEQMVSLAGGVDQNQRPAASVTDAVLAHVDSLRRIEEGRLFLFAHYFDAHSPYDPPAPYDALDGERLEWKLEDVGRAVAMHQQRACGEPLGMRRVIGEGLTRELVHGADGRALPVDQKLARLYAGEVAYAAAEVGRLLDGLEERGLLDQTLVVLTGDHGETFWEHADFWNHGLWVYETTQHVPLVLRFPDGRGAGTRVATPVSTVDLVPTLCELLGFELPDGVEGTSLVPAIDGRPFRRGPVFAQATQPMSPRLEPADTREEWGNLAKPRSVRDGRWKYVWAPYLELAELYDLEHDPGERVDLLRADPPSAELRAQAERLHGLLEVWVRETPGLPSHFDPSQQHEAIKRLDEMGYGGDDPEGDR